MEVHLSGRPKGQEMTDLRTPSFRTLAFVDGDFREAANGERFTTENPATGSGLAEIAAMRRS